MWYVLAYLGLAFIFILIRIIIWKSHTKIVCIFNEKFESVSVSNRRELYKHIEKHPCGYFYIKQGNIPLFNGVKFLYELEEVLIILDTAKEFGFKIRGG